MLGASGYVGSRLVPELIAAGHEVRCLVRDPGRLGAQRGRVEVVQGDVLAGYAVRTAVAGVDVVYHLVHSLARGDFADADRVAASLVAEAAAEAGVSRIVYLGGLRPDGRDRPSPHLASRAEVGDIFVRCPVPAAVLQAAVITGSGSTSFEMLRYLTERLPVMITPLWVGNRTQPIAIADVLRYLLVCAELPAEVNRSFDIGGPDVLTYLAMMQRYARIVGLPRRLTVSVPLFSPVLSAYWVELITPVSRAVAAPLIESLAHELVCDEDDIRGHVPDPPEGLLDYEQSVRHALSPAAAGGPAFTEERSLRTDASTSQVWRIVESIGGDNGWYTLPLVWELRGWIDQLLGGIGAHRGRRDARRLRAGETLDWWRVEEIDTGRRLLLRAEMKMPGTAWLEMVVEPTGDGRTRYLQRVTFVPAGLAGHVYWWAQRLGHEVVFGLMARGIVGAAENMPPAAPAQQEHRGQQGATSRTRRSGVRGTSLS